MFEPLTTTGVPLAVREDWRAVLRAAADTGTLSIWVAFHGVGEVHDRQVNRSGAYAETCLAAGRARSAGLSVGGNVFLTTASVAQLDELTAATRRLPVNAALCFTVASFLPTPRSWRNEQLRPALLDLLPHATRSRS
jgi:MoaA/NifB/PqqE/SkfB family radical SAM enzyme